MFQRDLDVNVMFVSQALRFSPVRVPDSSRLTLCTRFIVCLHFMHSVPRVSHSVCSVHRVSALHVLGSSCL